MSLLDGGGINGYGSYDGVDEATAGTIYDSDYREASKLDAYTPAPTGSAGMEWWERLAAYGATRAIDAQFGPPAINKTGVSSTYAGQDGRTYARTTGQPVAAAGSSMLPMLAVAAVAALALLG